MHICENATGKLFQYNMANMNSLHTPHVFSNSQTTFLMPGRQQVFQSEATFHQPRESHRKAMSTERDVSLTLIPVEGKQYHCEVCSNIFPSQYGGHQCQGLAKNGVECYVCNKVFLSEEEFEQHLKDETQPLT